ncbi:MAG: HlyD family efflux transporter periplasmic adaptor subunit [Tepidanaerobacteraceae bacterium]|nr:HlyD family efflux transporter periplasmic adaptor subunit [Tepidanaerobacteraceae bacterium]
MPKKLIKMSFVLILIAAVVFAGYKWWSGNNSSKKTLAQTASVARVTRGDLEKVISASGTLEPMDQDTIYLKVDGTVKKVYHKEGDVVKKGDLLYELEDPSLEISLKKAQVSISQAKLNLNEALKKRNKLVVYAPEDGVVKSLDVKIGDSVNENTVLATTLNEKKNKVKAPFNSAQIKNIKVGQKAEVFFVDYLYSVEGTVTKVDSVATPASSGARYYYATVEIDGNYYVDGENLATQVYISTPNGKEQSLEQVYVEQMDTVEVKPEISSKIKEIYVEEGDTVKKGQKLFLLDDEDIESNIEQLQMSLNQAELDYQSKLEDKKNLLVNAPIDGTIIEQNVREGDLIKVSNSSSSSNEAAAVIVDYSKMQVVLAIDELDITSIELGMPVKITADAVSGEEFQGVVEKIADEGTSQNNVSTFDVTVTLDKTPKLKAGMTVDAQITVAKKENVLMLPVAAVQQKDGKSYVIPVRKDNSSNGEMEKNSKNNSANSSISTNGSTNNGNRRISMNMVEVKTGISNDDYIEIVSGLNEGDMVLVPTSSTSTTSGSRQGGPPMGPMMMERRSRG